MAYVVSRERLRSAGRRAFSLFADAHKTWGMFGSLVRVQRQGVQRQVPINPGGLAYCPLCLHPSCPRLASAPLYTRFGARDDPTVLSKVVSYPVLVFMENAQLRHVYHEDGKKRGGLSHMGTMHLFQTGQVRPIPLLVSTSRSLQHRDA